jgi:Astacin (Peptidase family M12A)
MAVKKRNVTLWNTPTISYAVGGLGTLGQDWLAAGITRFNNAVGRVVFVPAASAQAAQVEFQYSSAGESAIGRTGQTPQVISFHDNGKLGLADYKTLHHEICHCLGLGHEQFHTGFTLRGQLIQALTGSNEFSDQHTLDQLQGQDWEDLGAYDATSIMMYDLRAMANPGRIEENAAVAAVTVLPAGPAPATPPTAASSSRPRSSSDPVASKSAPPPVTLLTPRIQFPPGYALPGSDRLSAADLVAINRLLP